MPVIHEVKIDAFHDFFYLGYMYVKHNVNIPTIYLVLIVIVGFSFLSVILFRHKQKLVDFVLSRRVHQHSSAHRYCWDINICSFNSRF